MRKQNKHNGTVMNLSFGQHITPLPTQKAKGNRKGNDVMIFYGDQNLYPNFLLELYNDSPIHKGVINSKVDYVLGEKIVYKNSDQEADFKVNSEDSINDLFRKITKDFIIFNYYAIEVIYNGVGEAVEHNHVPANLIRTNKAKNKFWYCDDWYLNSNQIVEFEGWKPKALNDDYSSKIYFYSAYTPSVNNVYPVPEYSGAIKSIETDIAIRDFHSNNINNNFSASSIITFFNGEPTEEIKATIEKSITNSYTGVNGKKLIVNFANEESKGAEVTNISASDWNDAFLTLKENTVSDIIVAHSLTSPLLAGISIAGQLGGNSELETAYTIFKNLYVINKRSEILNSLNVLFKGIFNELDIIDGGQLFKKELDSSVLIQIMTIDELREMQGLTKLENGTGQRLVNDVPGVTASSLGNAKTEFSLDINNDDDEAEKQFQSVAHIGLNKEDFTCLRKHKFSNEDNRLINYLIEKSPYPGASLTSIKEALNNDFTIQEIRQEIAKLINARVIPMTQLIDSNDLRKSIIDNGNKVNDDNQNLNRIEIRYSYEGPEDNKNRPFCAKLVRANKYYTREDIQQMSTVLGFDIYLNKGGGNCRHRWLANTVVRNNN